ncbi:Mmr1p KNAG_0B02510 [Huiozyma naganishii CBS 8797]|uniref:Uncharacterized protein n=1 Tax=Huiozyma naganishii (strain ATCC MYA-139 / BCRC 22969 / CBS 8797 / KCTC 17520 / NBRC 10181 / NCYC 3082 / Yp74L-3) TaxID=1071383 RepID=J7RGM3_HUIN7|nr:hypothetical protein KNAG_0B02510 [Kazachstania naganishii CBS 8797]CCK68693.1 hypothetical protein KNAG_0B02510 [Kazachstania naganishii CBS 8797]
MYSPQFKTEQLTPSASPISLSLDDSSNPFHHLLASPTKMKLSDSVGFYPTSLSKLNDRSRTGRGRTANNNDLGIRGASSLNFGNKDYGGGFRSSSPIRFNILQNAKPKMFKKEFISQPNNLPLFSTLVRGASNAPSNTAANDVECNDGATSSIKSNPLLDDNLPKLSIRETLEKIQQHHQRLNAAKQKTPVVTNTVTTNKTEPILLKSNSKSSDMLIPPLEIDIMEKTDSPRDRIVSNTSTVCAPDNLDSVVPLETKMQGRGENVEANNFATDHNGFLQYVRNGNVPNYKKGSSSSNVNRYSFISSTSTDYDAPELFEQHQPSVTNASFHESQARLVRSTQHPPGQNSQLSNNNSNAIAEYRSRLESNKLDLKIKQLEVEIGELKLQNAQLLNSMGTNRLLEDKLILEMLQERQKSQSAGPKPETSEELKLKKKLKRLESKFEDYQKTLDKLYDTKKKRSTRPTKTKEANTATHCRISRISTKELQRFEETTDPSSSACTSFCSEYSPDDHHASHEEGEYGDDSERDDESVHKKLLEWEYEGDVDDEEIAAITATSSKAFSSRRGFRLNVPIEMQ